MGIWAETSPPPMQILPQFGDLPQKIPAPIKIKSALPPQTQNTPPPKTRNFMDMEVSCRKSAFFQVSIKLAQPFPAPELRTRILWTRGFFRVGLWQNGFFADFYFWAAGFFRSVCSDFSSNSRTHLWWEPTTAKQSAWCLRPDLLISLLPQRNGRKTSNKK